jgi:hypothetical protein
VIASGALHGMNAGNAGRAAMVEQGQERATLERQQAFQARLAEVVRQGGGSAQLRQMMQEALAVGDTDTARIVASVIPAVENTERENVPKPRTFVMNGREFQDTAEGVKAALAWRDQVLRVGPQRDESEEEGGVSTGDVRARSYWRDVASDLVQASGGDVNRALAAAFADPEYRAARIAGDLTPEMFRAEAQRLRGQNGGARTTAANTPARFRATQLLQTYGGDVGAALRDLRTLPRSPETEAVIREVEGLGYEQGRRSILGIGGGDGSRLEDLGAQYLGGGQ